MKEVAKKQVERILCTCLKCGHQWFPRSYNPNPRICVKCKTTYWDVPPEERRGTVTRHAIRTCTKCDRRFEDKRTAEHKFLDDVAGTVLCPDCWDETLQRLKEQKQASPYKKPGKLGETKRAYEIGCAGGGLYQYLVCIHCGKARWVALIGGKPVSLRCRTCAQLQAQAKRRKPYYRHLYSPSYPVREKTQDSELAWLAGIWDIKGWIGFLTYSGMGKGYEYPNEARTTCPECGQESRSYQGYLRHWSLVHKGISTFENSPAPIFYQSSERILGKKARYLPTMILTDSDENIIDEAFKLLNELGTNFKKISFAR